MNQRNEIRVGQHEVNPERFEEIQFVTPTGSNAFVDSLRADDDGDHLIGFGVIPDHNGELVVGHFRFPRLLRVMKGFEAQIVEHRKGTIEVVGTIAVGVAAGTGFLLRRRAQKHDKS